MEKDTLQDAPPADDPSTVTLGEDSWVREPTNGHVKTMVVLHGFTDQADNYQYMLNDKGLIPENIKIVCPSAPFHSTEGWAWVPQEIIDAETYQAHTWYDFNLLVQS